MREQKFRFWSELDEQWRYYTLEEIANNTWPTGLHVDWKEYTGLKDKNKLDIYEGHILSGLHKAGDPGWAWRGVIEWLNGPDESGNCFYGFYVVDRGSPRVSIALNLILTDKLEIIGNMTENPELLRGKA